MRKVIQLLTAYPDKRDEPQLYPVLWALCDDGSIWWKNISVNSKWQIESASDEYPNSIEKK